MPSESNCIVCKHNNAVARLLPERGDASFVKLHLLVAIDSTCIMYSVIYARCSSLLATTQCPLLLQGANVCCSA